MIKNFDYVNIKLASPEKIKNWGERQLPNGELVGEVLKSETVNYKTLKPEKGGLFCERIFGPVKNWECTCGKYKHNSYFRKICEECGVEVTISRVRRHRMGYIKLVAPVVHIWYLKGYPSILSNLLGWKLKDIEEMIYGKQDNNEIENVDELIKNDENINIEILKENPNEIDEDNYDEEEIDNHNFNINELEDDPLTEEDFGITDFEEQEEFEREGFQEEEFEENEFEEDFGITDFEEQKEFEREGFQEEEFEENEFEEDFGIIDFEEQEEFEREEFEREEFEREGFQENEFEINNTTKNENQFTELDENESNVINFYENYIYSKKKSIEKIKNTININQTIETNSNNKTTKNMNQTVDNDLDQFDEIEDELNNTIKKTRKKYKIDDKFYDLENVDRNDPMKTNYIDQTQYIYTTLENMDLNIEIEYSRSKMLATIYSPKRDAHVKRIRLLENFLITQTRPEWMIFKYLPVLPPGLRPLIQLDNGKFVSSDLNDLYRKIIIRNKRMSRLLYANAPELVISTEKRLIQEAVDTLIDNGKRGPTILDVHKRPLKSLADIIEGKQGRFRQNLLGKRVDYSGRTVIVVGPNLKLNQCGLPYEMAVELFLPFLINKLLVTDLVHTIKRAKQIIYRDKGLISKLLKQIIKYHPILLNRAPTLHRLGVQAFDAILVAGRAIQLHPLVCPAFNADFDGDQMAVHIPLSYESQLETKLCLLSPNNFLSPATGQPNLQPTQDMVLGFYYLTTENKANLKGSNHYFSNFEEVIIAYKQKKLHIHSSIWVRCENNLILNSELIFSKTIEFNNKTKLQLYNNLQQKETINNEILIKYIRTTPGRIIFNQFINNLLKN
ncbi:unnamed protein product [Choristocarpus tenellus]|uniref:RNA polymerase beta' subunit n=1 Tax=Choristocarpus tenellus TaxID=116065 RepID=UPI002E78AD15|nr:RNA polymerase beta' subunit [Choristocarpus tenellus]WAM62348.1 RNA polymerase beta' subunit [Choristocarpus tenellus]